MSRVVAITGASAGIGRAAAEQLGRLGMPIALLARRAERLEAIAQSIRAGGGRAIAVAGDVTDEGDVRELADRAVAEFGRLDVMIANAGIGFHGALEDTPPEIMRRLLDVNFMGTFHAARASLPIFRRQGGGHLILISSIAGQRGIGFTSGYCATKAAQIGLAESLRAELAGTGIHVSVVFPVSTITEFHDAIRRDFGHAVSGLGPKQSADDVARAIARCLEHPRVEVYPHWKSRGLVLLNALAPAFTDRLVQKYGRRRR
ncbi:MAG: SDR family NAD(P)-dependent oxidoreductase [Vicinamibacterales bacterium]